VPKYQYEYITAMNFLQSETYPSCPTDAQAVSNAFFGQGTGPVYLNNVICSATHRRLLDCTFDRNTGGRTHTDDVGARCTRTRK